MILFLELLIRLVISAKLTYIKIDVSVMDTIILQRFKPVIRK
jgi:hypothetical protein